MGGPTGTQQSLKFSNGCPTYSLKALIPTWPRIALNATQHKTGNLLKILSFSWFLFFTFLYLDWVVSQHKLYMVRSRCHVKWTYILAEHKRAKRYLSRDARPTFVAQNRMLLTTSMLSLEPDTSQHPFQWSSTQGDHHNPGV